MRKGVIAVFILVVVLMFGFMVLAEDSEEEEGATRAYNCLSSKVGNSSSLNLEESFFSALALGNVSNAVKTIEAQKDGDCWPKGNCNLKSTAQAAIVYNRLGKNTTGIINWIMSKNNTASGLKWYLQITIPGNYESNCVVIYRGGQYSIKAKEDLKLEGNPGVCLQIAQNGYKLVISDSCLNEEFITSCDKAFKTNLIYEKGTGGVTYVSYKTEDGSPNGKTSTKVTAKCFKTGSDCDYEGSLWAVNALYATGKSRSEFIPYLASLAPDNLRYFPSAFLYHIVGSSSGSIYHEGIMDEMKVGGYWDVSGGERGKFFDTSLALMALGKDSPESANSIQYLLALQDEDGCWNSNIRDTSFLLYTLWPQSFSNGNVVDISGEEDINIDIPGGGGGTGGNCTGTCRISCFANESLTSGNCSVYGNVCCKRGGGGTGIITDDPNEVTECVIEGFHCVQDDSACLDANGDLKDKSIYACFPWTKSCCTVDVPESVTTCSEMSGSVCTSEETCRDSTVSASDGACCLSTCEMQTGTCTGTCKSSCSGEETFSNAQCSNTADVCCVGGTSTGSGGSGWWIIILILGILIVLVVIGLLYKDKIRLWWYKRQGKTKTSPYPFPPGGMASRGAIPPQRILPRGVPRFAPQNIPQRAPPVKPTGVGRPGSAKDKEMEETMKKLREMSK